MRLAQSRNGLIENADGMRERAMVNRNKGRHTGAMAKGHKWKRPDPERGSWAELVQRTQADWSHAVSEARAQFDWDARLQWIVTEDGHAIPF